MFRDYIFYDIEVFKYNSMVVFKNYDGETIKVFSSSLDGLGSLYDKGILELLDDRKIRNFVRGKTLVGYNNYFYDDRVLRAMTDKRRIPYLKNINDGIINGKNLNNYPPIEICKTLDVFQQIDVSRPSLKKIEGNMGKSIIESSVDFNIDRPLTPQENYEIFLYCEYDVLYTLEIFKKREEYFKSKNSIIEMIKVPKDENGSNKQERELQKKAVKWNTTSIIGTILAPKYSAKNTCLVPIKMFDSVDSSVFDMWKELYTWSGMREDKFKIQKVVIEEMGVKFEFGWGGLHAVPTGVRKWENVKLRDVTSMYPSIIINLKGLGEKTSDYKEILETSTTLKHQGKKEEREPYKLILNSTYGLLNNKYSRLNNPYLAYSVCIYGQIALYTLCKKLYSIGVELVNVNTDGVAYVIDDSLKDIEEEIVKEWEEEFNLSLELDNFKLWYQRDVNNYIAVTEGDYMVLKGGDVNKYYKDRFFANNDIRIMQIALVDYLIKGVPVEETIQKNLDKPLLFQYILQAGHTYKGVVYKNSPDKLLDTKINRVFAIKKGVEILKKRQDNGLVKFADAPGNMYLWNDDVDDIKDFEKIIDKQWYYDLTIGKLKAWELSV